MNHDPFETAACAVWDLAARLAAELDLANRQLEEAEHRLHEANSLATDGAASVPFGLRRARTACRRRIALLHQVLADMPTLGGDHHAQSA